MSERLHPHDTEPQLASSLEAKKLKAKIKDVAMKFGSERVNHDGYTATFQLDSRRLLTCRYITKTGDYGRGSFVNYWRTLEEYPDGSSMQLHREYQITGKNEVFFSERAVHYDEDEEEIPFSAERPEGMHTLVWNRMLRKFREKFEDSSLYSYQVEEITGILDSLTEAQLVACEDETVDDL